MLRFWAFLLLLLALTSATAADAVTGSVVAELSAQGSPAPSLVVCVVLGSDEEVPAKVLLKIAGELPAWTSQSLPARRVRMTAMLTDTGEPFGPHLKPKPVAVEVDGEVEQIMVKDGPDLPDQLYLPHYELIEDLGEVPMPSADEPAPEITIPTTEELTTKAIALATGDSPVVTEKKTASWAGQVFVLDAADPALVYIESGLVLAGSGWVGEQAVRILASDGRFAVVAGLALPTGSRTALTSTLAP